MHVQLLNEKETQTMAAHSIIRTSKPYPMTEEEYCAYEDDMIGICRACGAEREMTEPDAEEYPCPECGAMEVYGVAQLMVRGEVDL